MPEAGEAAFRPIGQLADLVGGYCWAEHRLFALTGGWAAAAGDLDAEVRVFLAGVAREHAAAAGAWRDRLPVRAGVDRRALIGPAAWGESPLVSQLTGPGASAGPVEAQAALALLTGEVLPLLLAAYEAHATTAGPVNEGPVLGVLEVVRRDRARELACGHLLQSRLT